MRPLAVLILILCAVGALVLSILSNSDTGDRGAALDPVARPDLPEASTSVELTTAETPRERAPTVEPVREEVDAGEGGGYRGFIDGIVIGPDKIAVAEAKVSLLELSANSELTEVLRVVNKQEPPKPKQVVVTGAEGTFRFEGLKPGRKWSIVVTHEAYNRAEVNGIDVPEQGGVEEKIELLFGRAFRGTITAAEGGQPIAGAELVLDNPVTVFMPVERRSAVMRSVMTEADGTYLFTNIGGGPKSLIIRADGYATKLITNLNLVNAKTEGPAKFRRNMAKTPKTIPILDFELVEAKVIAGRVVGPDRSGVSGALVEAISHNTREGSRGETRSGANGEFLISNLAEGLYTLRTSADGWHSTPIPRVEAGDTGVEIVLAEQGGVMGRVVDDSSGRPLRNFICKVRHKHPTQRTGGAVAAERKFRREDGSFEVSGIPEGQYVVQAEVTGFATSFSEPFQVTQGMTTPDIVVRVTKGGTIKGLVIDAYTGDPLVGAKVQSNDSNYIKSEFTDLLGALVPSATTKKTAVTDAQGEFELALMTPADYQIIVEKSGFTPLTLNNISVGDGLTSDVGIKTLSRGSTVSGTVFGPDGLEVAGASVLLQPIDQRMYHAIRGRTDARGRFILRNAAPGPYRLSASRPSRAHESPFAQVVDIRNSEVELNLTDGADVVQDLTIPGAGG